MSTIRTNAIVDNAGGNTATINGITPALASQAEAEAGTDNTKLMTPLRARQAAGPATAALSFGAIGTYCFAHRTTIGTVTEGATYAGSTLFPASAFNSTALGVDTFNSSGDGYLTRGGTALSGTWRCMGRMGAGGGTLYYPMTLFMRIS